MRQGLERMGGHDPANAGINVDPDALDRTDEAEGEQSDEEGEQGHRGGAEPHPLVPSCGSGLVLTARRPDDQLFDAA